MPEQMTQEDKVQAVNHHIAQTTGTEQWYEHYTKRLIYTDGVLFVAETCEAHWLIDLIASWQIQPRVRQEPFQVWQLTKEEDGNHAIRCWTDTPGKSRLLAVQKIEYTDFPADLLPFSMWVEGGVLILPAEH